MKTMNHFTRYIRRLTCRLFGHTLPGLFNLDQGTPRCDIVNWGWDAHGRRLGHVRLRCPRCGRHVIAGFVNQWRELDPAQDYPQVYALAKFAGTSGAGGNARDRRAFRRRMVRAASRLIHNVTG